MSIKAGEEIMRPVTIRAHFDGEHIRLDESVQLEPDAKLLIIVLPKQPAGSEETEWACLSMQGLENAYGEDEPDYSTDAIIEANPEYEGR
jgi:hypothetical protein